ncbi:MAG: hypothetical protein GXP54_10260 [Deltaproteobacteria bacterium]|nr:hypothetical protein [Deltaproteobacteria bacterium]
MKHVPGMFFLVMSGAVAVSCSNSTGGHDDTLPDTATDIVSGDSDTTDLGSDGTPDTLTACPDGFCPAGPGYAPDPTKMGPYPVGVRTVILVDHNPTNLNEDGTPRELRTEIWYPTTEEYRDGPHTVYAPLDEAPADLLPLFEGLDPGSIDTPAVRDAPVRPAGAPYPLVLFSHGAFAVRYQSVFFTVKLASHGYVVISPDHQNNTIWDLFRKGFDRELLGYSAWHRPLDATFLMDQMTEWTKDPANDFFQIIDTDHMGASGHSFGGFTSTAAACLIPEVKAIVAMSPAAEMTFLSGCAPQDLPGAKMIMGGLMDNTLDYEVSYKGPWEMMPPPKWLLTLARGGHYTFTDMCRFNLAEVAEKTGYSDAKEAMTDGCGAENWDFKEAQEAINLYAIGFFNRYLRGSPDSDKYLTPEAGKSYGNEIDLAVVKE